MRNLLLVSFLISLSSCSDHEPRMVPKSVISLDSMPFVLAEMQLFNATAQHRESRKLRFQSLVLEEQKAWFDSLHLSESRFDSSMRFYLQDPNQMEEIYVQAMELLSSRAAELQTLPNAVKKEVPEKIRLFEEAHPVLGNMGNKVLEQHKQQSFQAEEDE